MHFQEYWVRLRARPPALAVNLVGIESTRPAAGVTEALTAADLVLLAPSNPVVSIGPILAVPGIRQALRAGSAPVVGFAGILGGAPVLGMAQHLLPAIGVEVDAAAVGEHYGARSRDGVLDVWAMDVADAGSADRVRAAGLRPVVTGLIMVTPRPPRTSSRTRSSRARHGAGAQQNQPRRRAVMIEVFAPAGIAEIVAGDDLAAIVIDAVAADPQGPLQDGDIVVITSKIVSKAEGRAVPAADRETMIAAEAVRTVALRGTTAIVRTRTGLTLAAAGVDRSNVEPASVLLLPVDPDASAARLRMALEEHTGLGLGVIISDTAGRPWRIGQTDQAIGVAGVRAVRDYAGVTDGYGNPLRVTVMALADELAGAADLVKGKLDSRPVAVVRGLAGLVGDPGGTAAGLVRPAAEDLFPLGSREAVLAAALIALGRPEAYEDLVRLDAADRPAAVLRLAGLEGFGGGPAGADAVRRPSDPAVLSGRG